ncbi:MAG: CHAT domain-containing protein, partial [Microcystaceae cyanobacterium]
SAQNITQQGSLTVNDTFTLNATENIILDNSNNDFNTVSIQQGENVILTDINEIEIENSQVSGELEISAQNITQQGSLTVNDTFTLNATENIILDNSNNDFNTVSIQQGENVTLNDINDIKIENSQVTGELEISAQNITQQGSLTVDDTLTLNATENIILDNSNNDFNTVSIQQGENVTLSDSNEIEIENSQVTGELEISAQNITQQGSLTVNDTLTLNATENIILDDVNNDFNTVSIQQGENVTLTDSNNIEIETSQITGELRINSIGITRLTGNILAESIITDAPGTIEIGAIISTSNEQIYNDQISLINETILSGTELTLNQPLQGEGQDLTINFSETVQTRTITNTNNLTIIGQQGIDTENLSAQGDIFLESDRFVRVRQGATTSDISILTTEGSNITITHGEPIFEVGSSQYNYSGTANQISNGQDTIPVGTTVMDTLGVENNLINFTNPPTPQPSNPNPEPPITEVPPNITNPEPPITEVPPTIPNPEPPITEVPPTIPNPEPPITNLPREIASPNRLPSITNPVSVSEDNQSVSSTDSDSILNDNNQTTLFSLSNLSQINQTEKSVSEDFEAFLGVNAEKTVTLADAQKIIQMGYENTNIRTGIIYAIFQPSQEAQTVWRYNSARQTQAVIRDPEHEQLVLMLITSKGAVVRKKVKNVTRQDIMQAKEELQATILNPRRPDAYLKPSQQLYQWLIAPLETELKSREVENLAFILDAGLRSLPIAALHDGERFLVEKYSMSIIPSLSLTDFRYSSLQGQQVLAMGASEFTDKNSLPAVSVELSIITEQLWQGEKFLNEAFTLNNLNQTRQNKPFKIIHLATHAAFEEGELSNSYIQLWNEKLQLDQLRKLNLDEPAVDLLVLSACQTALGSNSAELGFAGAAVLANVKSVLGSLWEVSDEGTLGLMTIFYQSLQISTTKSQALRQAQLSLLNEKVRLEEGQLVMEDQRFELPPIFADLDDHNLSHPYYWAAFTLIGNPW